MKIFAALAMISATLFVLIIAECANAAEVTELTGKVVGVHDGDTLTLLTSDKQQVKIRLAEIDAPEMSQPYGQAAKSELSDILFDNRVGKDVRAVVQDTDRYGRKVARIYTLTENTDVNTDMVARGAAWAYTGSPKKGIKGYLRDKRLLAIQSVAKDEGFGLWALQADQRVPPWEWRKGIRAVTPEPVVAPRKVSCGTKKYCNQMESCEEAGAYLAFCPGMQYLDADRDGTPCEALCGQ